MNYNTFLRIFVILFFVLRDGDRFFGLFNNMRVGRGFLIRIKVL